MNVSDLAKGVAEATGSSDADAKKAIKIAASKKVNFTAAKGLKDKL
jgi:nucleoid DNA-binding protein